MADDLGYGDAGCYGGKILSTPSMDRLAGMGARFTDFYVTAPVCTPTRGSFLTGRYPRHNGLTQLLWPEDQGGLSKNEKTISEFLLDHGYRTALVGKWHVGHASADLLPLARGFQSWFGMPYPNDMDSRHPRSIEKQLNWPPFELWRDGKMVESPVDLDSLTRRYTAECTKFIRENADHPWFLFYASHAPHPYLAASDKFRGKSRGGLYGDMVEEMDWSIGEVLDALKATGQLDRTFIFFTNDNGATVRSPEQIARESADPNYATLRADGSGESNAPLRGGKGTPYEGGIRVPAIAVLPGVIPAGQVIREPAIITDVFPTIAELARQSAAGIALDGQSLVPALTGRAKRKPEPLFFDCPKVKGCREGDWKIVFPSKPWDPVQKPPELYNLRDDPGETKNLAADQPEILMSLMRAIKTFEQESPAP